MTDKEGVVGRLIGLKEYYIDFGSWHIEAVSPEQAEEKARKMIKEGDVPDIIDVGEV
jgi:hypothetical protein